MKKYFFYGDLEIVHLKKECFPRCAYIERKYKTSTPFQVMKRTFHKTYELELQKKKMT